MGLDFVYAEALSQHRLQSLRTCCYSNAPGSVMAIPLQHDHLMLLWFLLPRVARCLILMCLRYNNHTRVMKLVRRVVIRVFRLFRSRSATVMF